MHDLVACLFCGGIDPANDQLLLQAAIAGGITTPWLLRARLLAFVARVRGRLRGDEASGPDCPIPGADDESPLQ